MTMALRLGGLADLDPEAVPLPAGTEVTTRVDGLRAFSRKFRKREIVFVSSGYSASFWRWGRDKQAFMVAVRFVLPSGPKQSHVPAFGNS